MHNQLPKNNSLVMVMHGWCLWLMNITLLDYFTWSHGASWNATKDSLIGTRKNDTSCAFERAQGFTLTRAHSRKYIFLTCTSNVVTDTQSWHAISSYSNILNNCPNIQQTQEGFSIHLELCLKPMMIDYNMESIILGLLIIQMYIQGWLTVDLTALCAPCLHFQK